jgi:hypothetical protein
MQRSLGMSPYLTREIDLKMVRSVARAKTRALNRDASLKDERYSMITTDFLSCRHEDLPSRYRRAQYRRDTKTMNVVFLRRLEMHDNNATDVQYRDRLVVLECRVGLTLGRGPVMVF